MGRDRTADTRIFSPLLYQLSYRTFYILLFRTSTQARPDDRSDGDFQSFALPTELPHLFQFIKDYIFSPLRYPLSVNRRKLSYRTFLLYNTTRFSVLCATLVSPLTETELPHLYLRDCKDIFIPPIFQ